LFPSTELGQAKKVMKIDAWLVTWLMMYESPHLKLTWLSLESAGAEGWYHISIANISAHSWRMWIPPIFAYFFSGFTFFVMKQEYKHFVQLRMVSFLVLGRHCP
jgi:hypothetical protein